MSRSEPQINIRIPAELKERIERVAAENKRSVTAEMISRLEASFAMRTPSEEVTAILLRMQDEMAHRELQQAIDIWRGATVGRMFLLALELTPNLKSHPEYEDWLNSIDELQRRAEALDEKHSIVTGGPKEMDKFVAEAAARLNAEPGAPVQRMLVPPLVLRRTSSDGPAPSIPVRRQKKK